MKWILARVLPALMLAAMFAPAAQAATPKLNAKDFSIKIGGKKLDLLKKGVKELEKLTGKSMTDSSDEYVSMAYLTYGGMKFEAYGVGDTVIRSVTITGDSKVKTARGVGIGTYWREVLDAYGAPDYDDEERMYGAYIGYYNPLKKTPTNADYARLNKSRPLTYYGIFIEFDNTMNVTSITICDHWPGE